MRIAQNEATEMDTMQFSIFDIVTWMIIALPYFIVLKILTQDTRLSIWESLYIVLAIILIAISSIISINIVSTTAFNTFTISLMLFIYFCTVRAYTVKKSFILLFLSILIITSVGELLCTAVVSILFPNFLPSIPNFPFPIGLSSYDFFRYIPYLLFMCITPTLSAFAFVKTTASLRKHINSSERAQTILAFVSVVAMVFMAVTTISWRELGYVVEYMTLSTAFLFIAIICTFVCFYFYIRSLCERIALQAKESEHLIQQQYTEQIEEQQKVVRKFMHDYQNILVSINSFVVADDLNGLKRYMQKVSDSSATLTKDALVLERLSKIKQIEIKVFLAEKLMVAQSLGKNISTSVEALEEIEHIPLDSIALVRMLGIILDNAIEALDELQSGELSLACIKEECYVVFIIKNTCASDLFPYSKLRQEGFTTKGEGRGLGLNILRELVDAHPNVDLQTIVKDGYFVQKLTIGEE